MGNRTLSSLVVSAVLLLALPVSAQDISKKETASKTKTVKMHRQPSSQTTVSSSEVQTWVEVTKKASQGIPFRGVRQERTFQKATDETPPVVRHASQLSRRTYVSGANGEVIDDHGIIVKPGEGVRKVYARSGFSVRDINGEVQSNVPQSGYVQIVECEDGTVYIRNIVLGMSKGTWTKGTREGNTITVPIKQTVYYDAAWDESCSLYWGINDFGYSRYDGYLDAFTFNVDDAAGTISLEGTSEEVFMGIFWDSDGSFSFSGDWETVWTYDHDYAPLPVSTVTPPSGLETTTWYTKGHTYYTGSEYRNDKEEFFKGNVTVGFDGQDVYLQGLFPEYPDAWIKGSVDGGTVTFSGLQLLGADGEAAVYAVGSDGSDLLDFSMTYDAESQTLTSANILLANADKEDIDDRLWISDITISQSDPFPPIETLPYANSFDTRDAWEWFTIINANDDSHTWRFYEEQGRYYYDMENAADDWLISPPIKLEAGKHYRFAIDAHSQGDVERMEVKMGTAPTVDAMTQQVIASTDIEWDEYQTLKNDELTVGETGYYHFGIHAISDAYLNVLFVDNFLVEEVVLTAPAMVSDLTVTPDEGSPKAVITFTAPATNIGGDPLTSHLTKIELLRDNAVIHTFEDVAPGTPLSYTDDADDIKPGTHSYQVIAYNADGRGEKSEVVTAYLVQVMSIPYVADFSEREAFDQFMCIDANEDFFTWMWNENEDVHHAFYSYHSEHAADDYLISPPLRMEAGKNYDIVVNAGSLGYPERFEVLVGKSPTVEGLTTKVIEDAVVTDEDDKPFDGMYTAEEDGIYYVAIHCISDPDLYELWINKLTVEPGPDNAAPAAPAIEVAADATGGLSAVITVTAPTTSMGGDALTGDLSKIELYRDGQLIAERANVAPGSTVEFEDNTMESMGTYSYYAQGYNAAGFGKKSEVVSAYVGVDLPMDVDFESVSATDRGSSVLLTWDKVGEVGRNGMYVNPANVDYMIYDVEESWFGYSLVGDPLAVLRDADSCELTCDTDEGDQQYKYWGIKTANEAGENEEGTLAHLLVGKPYDLPVVEGFQNGSIHYLWDTNAMVLQSNDHSDGDGSAVAMTSRFAEPVYLTSGKLNVKDASNPTLLFDVKGYGVGTLLVIGNKDGGTEAETLSEVNLTQDYTTVKVPLASLKDGRYAQIGFVFDVVNPTVVDDWTSEIQEEGDAVVIDHIRILDLYDHNLAAEIAAPSAVQAGKSASVRATVTNWGEQAAKDFTLTITSADATLMSKTVSASLAPFSTMQFDTEFATTIFDEPGDRTLTVKVDYAQEQFAGDNEAETQITIKESALAAPGQLTAQDKNGEGVDLAWEAPVAGMLDYTEEFDDTEAFEPFTIGGVTETQHAGAIGEWTVYDGNGKMVYSWDAASVTYPNQNAASAWMVFDPDGAGFEDIGGRSGRQVMMSMCPMEAGEDGMLPAADHWLISPELSGAEQEISFYLRAISNMYGSESFEVWASMTDNRRESFSLIEQFMTDEVDWTLFTATLPEGTKYFAIRHTSTDVFGVMVDDISFNYNGGKVSRYNIYYEGQLIATVENGVTTYTVAADQVEAGERTFAVSAVYANGQESKPATATISVTTGIRQLVVDGHPVDVYSVDGKLVRRQATSTEGLRGLYIVNGKKVMVK